MGLLQRCNAATECNNAMSFAQTFVQSSRRSARREVQGVHHFTPTFRP